LTIYGLPPTQQQAHNRTPAGFLISIYGLNQHNSKATITFCRIFISNCSYGPTTTQQQAHNRTPAGFANAFTNNKIKPQSKSHQDLYSLCKM
jgi:hypothetical protein